MKSSWLSTIRRSSLLLALFAQSATAQISEADRLARCQNNRDALANLQTQQRTIAYQTPGAVWTTEQVSRARTALQSIDQHIANRNDLYRESSMEELYRKQYRVGTEQPEDEARLQELYRRERAEEDQVETIGRDFGILCGHFVDSCSQTVQKLLAEYIDQAVAANGQNERLNQQIAAHRANLVALRCDEAVATFSQPASSAPEMSGGWRGGNGAGSIYAFSQNGSSVTWTRSDNDEVGTATVSGSSISASYRSSYGSGSSSGTIEFDASGRPVRIRWSNGDAYLRQ